MQAFSVLLLQDRGAHAAQFGARHFRAARSHARASVCAMVTIRGPPSVSRCVSRNVARALLRKRGSLVGRLYRREFEPFLDCIREADALRRAAT
jgi:hypothetical protein